MLGLIGNTETEILVHNNISDLNTMAKSLEHISHHHDSKHSHLIDESELRNKKKLLRKFLPEIKER